MSFVMMIETFVYLIQKPTRL